MSNIESSLEQTMEISGAIGAAVADYSSGMCLGAVGGGKAINIEVAAAGNSEVVRSKLRVMEQLGLEGGIKDILITLDDQYHLIFPIAGTPFFVYVALRNEQANLALTRHKMSEITKNLSV